MIAPEDFIPYESGVLSAEERRRFEAALARDEDALRYWVAQRQIEEALRAAHGTSESRTLLQRSILEVVSSASRDEVKRSILRPMEGRIVRRRALLGLAALAAAACVALLAWVSMDRDIASVVAAMDCAIERGGVRWPAKQGSTLRAKDTIIVSEHLAAGLTLEYRDATRLVMKAGSRATLGVDDHGGKQITFVQGALTARVSKQPSGAPMMLHTSEAVLTVVGTEFTVAAVDGQTNLLVKEGLVHMARPDGSNGVNVAAGQSMVFLPDSIHPPAPSPGSTYGQGLNVKTGRRNAFLWPFATDSMWNRPLGSAAHYEPVQSSRWGVRASMADCIIGRPIFMEVINFPVRRVLVEGGEVGRVRFPDKLQPGFTVHWPLIVVVDPYAARVMELRGADRLPGGDLTAKGIAISQLRGAGDRGLTTSGLSALGGVIRFGELTRGIPHALAVGVRKEVLAGNVQFGAWLAIPPSVDINGFKGAEFEVARALQDYGACIADSSDEPFTFYAWYENPPPEFADIVRRLVPLLQVVTQRDAGTPRRSAAPPIEDEQEH